MISFSLGWQLVYRPLSPKYFAETPSLGIAAPLGVGRVAVHYFWQVAYAALGEQMVYAAQY
jgi:hypothetical protein